MFEFQRQAGSFWEGGLQVPSINHFEFKSLNSKGKIPI